MSDSGETFHPYFHYHTDNPTLLRCLDNLQEHDEYDRAGILGKSKILFNRFFRKTSGVAREIGISVSHYVHEILNGAFEFIRNLYPQFTEILSHLRDAVVASAGFITSNLEGILSYLNPDTYKTAILAYICLVLILLALALPSSTITTKGRILLAIMTGVIYYSKSLKVTAATAVFVAILAKLAPLANLNITANVSPTHELQWDEKEVREDAKSLILNIVSVSVLFSAASTGIDFPTDDKSWEKLMKRHVLLHRSFQAWEFGATKIVELFESSARIVCKYVYGTEYTSMSFIQEIETLIMEVIDLTALSNQFDIGKDEELSLKIELLYTQYLQLRKIYANDRKVTNRLDVISGPLTAYYRRVTNKNPRANAMRKEPVVIAIKGGTGLGKTYLATAFQQDLLKICGKYKDRENLSGQIYARNIEQEFWDGYVGQPIVVFDDFGQHVDSVNNPNEEFFEVIRAANIFPYMLHSAELAEKANNPFKADFIYLTTNDTAFNPVSIISKEAFQRRVHIDVTMHIIEEVATIPTQASNSSETQPRLDREKLLRYKEENNLDEADFSHVYFKGKGTDTYTYEALICKIGEQYRIHTEEFEGRKKMAEIKKEQKLPRGCFTADQKWKLQSDGNRITSATFFNQPRHIQKQILQQGWSVYNSKAHCVGTCDEMPDFVEKCAEFPIPEHISSHANIVPPKLLTSLVFGKVPLGDNVNFELRSRHKNFLARDYETFPPESEDHFEEIEELFESAGDPEDFDCDDREYWDDLWNNAPRQDYYHRYMRAKAQQWYLKLAQLLGKRTVDNLQRFIKVLFAGLSFYTAGKLAYSLVTQTGIYSPKEVCERPLWNFYRRLTAGNTIPLSIMGFLLFSEDTPRAFLKYGHLLTTSSNGLCFLKVSGVALYLKDVLMHFLIHPLLNVDCQICKETSKMRECSAEDDKDISIEDLKTLTLSQLESLSESEETIEIKDPKLSETVSSLEGPADVVLDFTRELYYKFLNRYNAFIECPDCDHDFCSGKDERCPHPRDCEMFQKLYEDYTSDLKQHLKFVSRRNKNFDKGKLTLGQTLAKEEVDLESPTRTLRRANHSKLEDEVESHSKSILRKTMNKLEGVETLENSVSKELHLEVQTPVDPVIKRIFKLESGRACDSERKKKFNLEGLISEQADLLANKSVSNFWHLDVLTKGNKISIGNVFVLKGRKSLINIHFLEKISIHLEKDPDLRLSFSQHGKMKSLETDVDCLFTSKTVFRALDQTEFMIMNLPKEFPCSVDFSKHLIRASELSKLKLGVRCLLTRPEEVEGKIAFKTKEGSFLKFTTTIVPNLIDETKTHTYARAAMYDIATNFGDCGSPIFLNSNMFEKKLLGFHYSGKEGTGTCSVICYDDVKDLLCDEMSAAEPSLSTLQADKEILPNISCKVNGYVENPVTHPCATALRKSLIFECLGESEMSPAVLEPSLREEGPMLKGFMKYSLSQTRRLNRTYREAAVEDYFKTCISSCKIYGWEKSILSFEEACKGVEGNQFLAPLKRSKSAGYPYMLTQKKGKEGFFGKDDWDFTSESCVQLFKDCQRIEEQAKHGIVPEVIFVATLKDEKRSHAKIESKSTRVFSASPLHFTIVFRKYFAGFFSFIMRNKIRNESAVGTNVHSTDWKDIVSHLKCSDDFHLLAGDFSNFDGDLLVDIMEDILTIINNFYSDKNDLIRKSLWECLTHSKQLIFDIVLELFNGQPSGNPGTAIINSIYVSLLFRNVFYTLRESTSIPFSNICKIITYGDDHILSVHPNFTLFHNPYSFKLCMQALGHGYTDAFKNQIEETTEWQPLEKVAFLKRTFVRDPQHNYYYAPLELKSIREMVNWIHKSPSDLEATILNCEGAFRELCHHEQEVFTSYCDTIAGALGDQGATIRKLNYPLMRWQLRTGRFEVTTSPWV